MKNDPFDCPEFWQLVSAIKQLHASHDLSRLFAAQDALGEYCRGVFAESQRQLRGDVRTLLNCYMAERTGRISGKQLDPAEMERFRWEADAIHERVRLESAPAENSAAPLAAAAPQPATQEGR